MKNEVLVIEQPLPVPGKSIVQDLLKDWVRENGLEKENLVVQDLCMRGEMGKEKYGSYLMTFNGRSAPLDWYLEILDAIAYATQDGLEQAFAGNHELGKQISADTILMFGVAHRLRARLVESGMLI